MIEIADKARKLLWRHREQAGDDSEAAKTGDGGIQVIDLWRTRPRVTEVREVIRSPQLERSKRELQTVYVACVVFGFEKLNLRESSRCQRNRLRCRGVADNGSVEVEDDQFRSYDTTTL